MIIIFSQQNKYFLGLISYLVARNLVEEVIVSFLMVVSYASIK